MPKKPPTLRPVTISVDDAGQIDAKQGDALHTNRFRLYGQDVLFRLRKLRGRFNMREISDIKDFIEDAFGVAATLEDERKKGPDE